MALTTAEETVLAPFADSLNTIATQQNIAPATFGSVLGTAMAYAVVLQAISLTSISIQNQLADTTDPNAIATLTANRQRLDTMAEAISRRLATIGATAANHVWS